MKLIPKARPVRIRISSGGVEHLTLDSLKHHFDVSAIVPMINDGRLLRWLKQRGESAVAEMIESAGKITDIDVLKIFFPELKECKTELDMITKMHFMGLKKDSVYLFERDFANDVEAIKKVYYLIECDWQRILLNLSETNAEMALLYVKEAVNGNFETFPSVVINVIESAIRLGSKEAAAFRDTDEYKSYIGWSSRFGTIDKERTKQKICDVFSSGCLVKTEDAVERNIFTFVRDVLILSNDVGLYQTSQLKRFHKVIFSKRKKTGNYLQPEYALIYTLIFSEEENLLKDYETKSVVVKHYFEGKMANGRLSQKLQYIVDHLLDNQ